MKILIIGATGFVGSHLCNAATRVGHQVYALKFNQTKAPISMEESISWSEGDIVSDSFSIPEDIQAVVHAAAIGVSPQKTTWEKAIAVNTVGTLNVLRAAKRANIKNILTLGSILEIDGNETHSHGRLNPIGIYATTKAAGSMIAEGFARTYKMNLINARLTNTYGAGQNYQNLFPSLKEAALTGSNFKIKNGSMLKNFISIEYVCQELLLEIDSFSNMYGEVKNRVVCNDTAQTVYDFAMYWWKYWGAKGKLEQN